MYAKEAVVKGLLIVKTYALAAAQKVATAAQWLLNAAMSANPIGLAVIALAALAGAFVLAYKKSEWFRVKVDAAVTAIKVFFGDLRDKAVEVWNGIVDKCGEKIEQVKEIAGKIPAFFSEAWEAVKAGATAAVQWIKDKFAGLLDTFDGIKKKNQRDFQREEIARDRGADERCRCGVAWSCVRRDFQ